MPKDSTRCVPYLKALADPSRWRIVRELLGHPMHIGELVEKLGISQYNVSKHVRILREAGILETEREGKFVNVHITGAFRTKLSSDRKTLNLGCCTFHFDTD